MTAIHLGALWCAADADPFRAADGSHAADGVLSAEELRRAQGLASPGARRRFVAGRVLARTMLSELLGIPASSIVIEVSASGRPFLPGAGALHFSISHSADVAACAVAEVPVGVDVELADPGRNVLAIAQDVFHPGESDEIERVLSANGREAAALRFYASWTLKEAFLKLQGSSIWDVGNAPAFFLGRPSAPPDAEGTTWWCMEVPLQRLSRAPYVLSLGARPDAPGLLSRPELHLRHLLAAEPAPRQLQPFPASAQQAETGGRK